MVTQMTRITVSIELNKTQAEAYLRWLTHQYEQAMAEFWYSDQYRHCPEGFRGPRILEDHPHIAGMSRTLRELKAQLKEVAA
jgi:hypothetical protein